MWNLTLLVSILSIRGAFALTGLSYLPTESLPEGICQIRFHDYEFKPYNGKTPRLGVLACTASFLTPRHLLTASHCHLDLGYYLNERGLETSRRLDAQTIDIACNKNQVLHRRLEVKKRHLPKNRQTSPDWDLPDPDLLIIELKRDFPTRVLPLTISENPSAEMEYVDVFGYGRTDSSEHGIALTAEPFNSFDHPTESTSYHRTPVDLYKGTRITVFRRVGIRTLTALAKNDLSYPQRLDPIAARTDVSEERSFFELLFSQKITTDRDNAPIKLGDSGGPVLNPQGQIIGVHVMSTSQENVGDLKKLRSFSTELTPELRDWIRCTIEK